MKQVGSLRTENKFKKTEIGEIPVDWEVVRVKDVCKKSEYGYTESATEKQIGPKFLRITDIQDGRVLWDEVPYCECPDSLVDKYLLKPGDILFTRTGATTGKSYLIKDCPKAIFASYLIRIVTEEKIDSNFLYVVFNSFIYWRQITQYMGGSAQGGVNASSLSNIKVLLPPFPEQKKIADIFSTIDEAIEKSKEVIEKTKELKKGLMQELLTRGIGHKKFKKIEIGEIPVNWEVVKIGDVCEIVGGSTPSTNKKEYWNGDILWAVPTDITKLKDNVISDTEKKITDKGLASCAARLLPEGSILLTSRATIGECAINTKPMATNQGFASLICKNSVYNWFIFYRMIFTRKEIEKLGSGSTFKEVSKKSIRTIKIYLPSFLEQKKIAQILSSVDEEIEKEVVHKERLEKIKKGLMQVLLTGKIRVKV